MLNSILSLRQKALRIIKEEGWRSLYRKAIRKINLYRRGQPSMLKTTLFNPGDIMYYSNDTAGKWLEDNRNNFSNPFYILLNYLLILNKQLGNIAPVSCSDYENSFKEQCAIHNFPFEVGINPVHSKENIIEFIHEYDHAYLGKMINHVFIPLIRFLSDTRSAINLLDFGTGPTCGMYGEGGRFLFDIGKVNINRINFYGIDDLHKPQGAIFEKSTYRQCNILSFSPAEKFDLITGHHVLEHCYNWEDVIAHLSQLLKREGYLYMSFPRLGGFYDTAYRMMSPFDHCANFDIGMLTHFSKTVGLERCLLDVYTDPNGRFKWISNLYPELVNDEMADCFYNLCMNVDSKLLLGYHHYGHYVVFTKKY
jgi:SAM-dependent methyltransferase